MKAILSLFLAATLVASRFATAQDDASDAPFAIDDLLLGPDSDLVVGGSGASEDPLPVADSAPQRIDILVVYTPGARAYAGSTAAMKAAINTYVAATNTAYTNSDVNVVLKLTGTAEVSYTETGSFSTDLSRLATTSDSYLTTVPGLRDAYKADLVCLIRRDGAAGVAGIGYLGNLTTGFAPNAYSVVGDIWAVGNNSFPHETGHNFGCHHDHANGSGAARAYAYGHRFNGTNAVQYRTIMAYAPGSRISYFSNPSITYQGTATGVSGTGATAADNARLIEESSVVTRTFRNGGLRLGNMIVANINNTGGPDLVLCDAQTGERFFWAMSGATRTSSSVFVTVDPVWRIAGSGDFNADNKTDLVWENTSTGVRDVWLMNGTTRTSSVRIATVSPLWRIAAVGDFNADNKPDLVWENTSTGQRKIWLMNGTVFSSSVGLGIVGTEWRIGAAGDFNADGKADLVFEDSNTGARKFWFMNGAAFQSSSRFGTVDKNWRIVGAGDFNGDGKTDLAWENPSTNGRATWYMSGGVRTGGGNIALPEN